ncbi:PITH domain-containing protein 1 [Tanacetum coccineum]
MACMHDHSCEDNDCSSDWSLYKHIDIPKVSALNEAVTGSVKSVFKAWEQRLSSSEEIKNTTMNLIKIAVAGTDATSDDGILLKL